jgi:hypothetical protein
MLEDINAKQDIITNSYSSFETVIEQLQLSVFGKITDWLQSYIGEDRKKTLTSLTKELKKLVNSKLFVSPTRKYIKNFQEDTRAKW